MTNAKLHNEMVDYFFGLSDEPDERASKFMAKYPDVTLEQYKAVLADIESRLEEEEEEIDHVEDVLGRAVSKASETDPLAGQDLLVVLQLMQQAENGDQEAKRLLDEMGNVLHFIPLDSLCDAGRSNE